MFKKFFTQDIQIKLGAVVLAILLWFFVVTDDAYYYDLEIPLKVVGLPAEKAINNVLPEMVTGRFHGKGHVLLWAAFTLPVSETSLELDLSRTKKTQIYHLNEYFDEHPDKVHMPRDYKLELIRVVHPESLWVSIEDYATREVSVSVDVDIQPAVGYMLVGDIHVEPVKVQVAGPKSMLESLTVIKAPPLELKDVNTDIDETVSISIEPSQLLKLGKESLHVTADIQSIGTVEFTNVAVRLENVPAGVELSVIPAEITLEVEGGLDRLLDLKPEDFTVVFDFDQYWTPERHLYEVDAVLPEGVKRISRFIPEKVEVVKR